ncbi:catalase family peroxidase [Shewanella colwelliana]|uniref:catalase family peroxidase n=1 Tax=Shewanella colwelliana TaxID=23 RepID=UPI001C7D179E|nr:catalase family peroxidase [Shewanella colwelliana]
MHYKWLSTSVCLVSLITVSGPLHADVTGNDFIDVFEKLAGKHPGVRKGHAKGVCAIGEFMPTEVGRRYSDSPLFSSGKSAASIRFSMAGGNPHASETARSPRGIGVKLTMADGSVHNLAGLTTPVFPGKSPEVFLGLLETLLPNKQGKVDGSQIMQYRHDHPSTLPQFNWLQAHNPPSAYTSVNYHGIHAFYFVDGQGKKTKFKWRLVPKEGEVLLTDAQMEQLPDTFLANKLEQQLLQGPINYELEAVIGHEEDETNNPSLMWPDSREVVTLGTLSIRDSGDVSCEPINFDPNRLAKGIEPSDDPVLKIRSTAYAISFGKRLSGQ